MPPTDTDPPGLPAVGDQTLGDRLLAALRNRILFASREHFIQIYNTFVDQRPGDALRFQVIAARRENRQPIVNPEARTIADIEAALLEAKEAGFLDAFVAAFGDQLIGQRAAAGGTLETAKVLAAAGTPDGEARRSVEASLQAMVSDEPVRDPLQTAKGIMIARRRCCRILVQGEAGQRITGSGFLIGPRLVLTNWHVVRALLSPRAGSPALAGAFEAIAGSDGRLSVQFDFAAGPRDRIDTPTSVRVARDWLVSASPAHASEHGAHEGQPCWPANPADLNGFDDFAVIELERAIGYERGFYDILETPPPPLKGRILVFHHPGNFMMRLSTGTLDVAQDIAASFPLPPGIDTRILHNANTLGGSSGGLLLNWDMQPVALHQAGLRYNPNTSEQDETGQPLKTAEINAAIPIGRVVVMARAAIAARMGERTLPLYVADLAATGKVEAKPLIGRLWLQERILQARKGKLRIIVVRPGFGPRRSVLSGIGKSFTGLILDALLPAAEHRIVRVSAELLRGDARATAIALVDALGSGHGTPSASNSTAGQPAPAGNAAGAPAGRQSTELVDQVVPTADALRDLFLREAGNGLFWLVIDDLEKFTIPDTSTQALLEQLYREIAVHPRLRLILIGVKDPDLAALHGIDAEAKWDEALEGHLDRKDVESWLLRRLDDPSTDVSRVFAGTLVSASSRSADSPSKALAKTIFDDVEPELREVRA
jgi:hypothetical protein